MANSNRLHRMAQPNVAANGGIRHPSYVNAECARRDVQKQSMLQVIPLIENTPSDEPTRRSCRMKPIYVSKMLWKHSANGSPGLLLRPRLPWTTYTQAIYGTLPIPRLVSDQLQG